MKSQKYANIMIENWFDILGIFTFSIEHLPGKLNKMARIPSNNPILPEQQDC